MSKDYEAYRVDAESSEEVTAEQFNLWIDRIQADINAIENDQIPDDEIELVKIEGGGVSEDDVTTTGEANKIPQLDSDGNLIFADGAGIKVNAS